MNQISSTERSEILKSERKRASVYKQLRKEYNLAEKGQVIDPESGETMHIHKFMQKVGKQLPKKEITPIHKNFTKENDIYTCNICQETVRGKGNKRVEKLYDHMQSVHNLYSDKKKYLCPDCGAVYMSKGSLKTHKMISHTKEYKFFCPIEHCKKGFLLKNRAYDEHIRTHTGERPHLCSICGAGFNYKQKLQEHVAVHKGESPFVCRFCQKQFMTKVQKTTHERTHTGERPFKCQECGKRFVQSTHLRTHMRVHTGDAPYECEKCNQKFKYLPQRNSHICAI